MRRSFRFARVLLGCALTVAAIPGAAAEEAAEPVASRQAQKAQAYVVLATNFFQEKDYGAALEHLRQADALLDGHPSQLPVRFNIARCLEELNRPEEAIEAYEVYQRNPDTGPRVARAAAALEKLRATHYGLLVIRCEPADAELAVSGQGAAKCPWEKAVPPGRYAVEVKKAGFANRRLELGVLAGARREERITLRTGSDDGLTWVALAGGTFAMGSDRGEGDEKPVHTVTVSPFRLTRTEVTNAQFGRCVAAGKCEAPHYGDGTCHRLRGTAWEKGAVGRDFQEADRPVVCVDWDQARQYARFVGARLPSEAEWEFAARGGGQRIEYPWGNDPPTCKRAVMDEGGSGCGTNATGPVCSKGEHGGLCDMAGNVWEWLQDAYHESYQGAPANGSPRDQAGSLRVARGGSWYYLATYLRASDRGKGASGYRAASFGFRLAESAPVPGPPPAAVASAAVFVQASGSLCFVAGRAPVKLRETPSHRARPTATVPAGTELRCFEDAAGWRRVASPDASIRGYLPEALVVTE